MINSKYNRTSHLPWSLGGANDDKVIESIDCLLNVPIVVLEKVDGSNASCQADGVFARTHAHAPTHPSFDWLKAFYATIKHKIPNDLQLFGENMYAKHSIFYDNLPSYFLLFNVRQFKDDAPIWLSWDEVEMWAEEIGIPTVPVLFRGVVASESELKTLTESFMNCKSSVGGYTREGVVVRVAVQFNDNEFSTHVAKQVVANFVAQGTEHWKHQTIIQNKLKSE